MPDLVCNSLRKVSVLIKFCLIPPTVDLYLISLPPRSWKLLSFYQKHLYLRVMPLSNYKVCSMLRLFGHQLALHRPPLSNYVYYLHFYSFQYIL
jgi:hypothetical protein